MILNKKSVIVFVTAVALMSMLSCASAPPQPNELIAPSPIIGNSGKFMCPYTQDDVVALWVDKSVNAAMGATVGKTAGAFVGAKALEQVPFVGSLLGARAGEAIGRGIAVKACGGWDYIRETSDLSFNSLDDLAVWMYVTKSANEHYADVDKAIAGIYPKYRERFLAAIKSAPRR